MTDGIGIVSVCHGVGLAAAARALLPGTAVVERPIWHLNTPAEREEAFGQLSQLRHVFVAPLGPEYGDLAAGQLSRRLPRSTLLPPFTFFGFHPDTTFLPASVRAQVPSPIGYHYHSKIVIAAFLSGRSPAECAALFNALVFARLGFLDAFAAEKAETLRTFHDVGIDLASAFPALEAAGCFMHTPNHPDAAVFAAVMRAALRAAGLPADPAAVPEQLPDTLQHQIGLPVFPPLARRLGVPGSSVIRLSLAATPPGRPMGMEEFAAECFATYAAAPRAALRAAVGMVPVLRLLAPSVH